MKKTIFLDRDGIINELVYFPQAGIVDTPVNTNQVKLVFGIGELIRKAGKLGYLVIVISNQPAIGLHKISQKQFDLVDEKIRNLLLNKNLGLNAFYYCFHHPFAKLEKYKKICECRKPKIALFKKAAKEFNIDLSQSWMVGDGVDDIKAGKGAGCKTILLANINSTENLRIIEEQLGKIKPDFIIKKLPEALSIINP